MFKTLVPCAGGGTDGSNFVEVDVVVAA